ESAYQTYHDLADVLATDVNRNDQDKALYRASRFHEADCRFQAGDYRGALDVYQELSALYPQQVEKLHSLAGKSRCFFAMAWNDKANSVLEEIKRTLEALPDSCFDERASRWPRQKWMDWLETERRNDSQS